MCGQTDSAGQTARLTVQDGLLLRQAHFKRVSAALCCWILSRNGNRYPKRKAQDVKETGFGDESGLDGGVCVGSKPLKKE